MAFNIGDVVAHIKADTSDFKRGLDDAKDQVNGFTNKLQSGLKSVALGFGAISAGMAGVGAVAMNFGEVAGKYESVRDAFTSMTKGMVDDVEEFEKRVANASGGTIDRLTIIQGGTRALSLIGKESFKDFGGEFEKMAELSKKAARATGQDVDYMFESLILGVARSSKMILDNLGINVSVEEANAKYAESLGKTAEKLTMQEEKAALLQAALSALETNYGNVAVTSGGFQGAMQRLNTTFTNAKIEIGTALLPALNELVRAITPLIQKYLPPLIQLITDTITWFKTLSPQIQTAMIIFLALIPVIAAVSGIILALIPVIIALISPFGLVGIAIIALTALIIANWNEIKNTTITWYNNMINFFNNMINFIKGWGGDLISNLIKPFQDAWNKISDIVNKIKNALDFTKKHSPSTVDIVERGVKLVNNALDGLAVPLLPKYPLGGVGSSQTNGMTNVGNIYIDMSNAVISDDITAMKAGEKIGDAIINKLKANITI